MTNIQLWQLTSSLDGKCSTTSRPGCDSDSDGFLWCSDFHVNKLTIDMHTHITSDDISLAIEQLNKSVILLNIL